MDSIAIFNLNDEFDNIMQTYDLDSLIENIYPSIIETENITSTRFVAVTEQSLNNQIKNSIPKSTLNKRSWAMKIFREWLRVQRVRMDGVNILKEISDFTENDLEFCLKFIFAEVRKVNGDLYPPQTLKELGATIQHYFIMK